MERIGVLQYLQQKSIDTNGVVSFEDTTPLTLAASVPKISAFSTRSYNPYCQLEIGLDAEEQGLDAEEQGLTAGAQDLDAAEHGLTIACSDIYKPDIELDCSFLLKQDASYVRGLGLPYTKTEMRSMSANTLHQLGFKEQYSWGFVCADKSSSKDIAAFVYRQEYTLGEKSAPVLYVILLDSFGVFIVRSYISSYIFSSKDVLSLDHASLLGECSAGRFTVNTITKIIS